MYLCGVEIKTKMCKLRIKDLCREKGITQAELARRMNTTPSLLSLALKRNVSVAYLERISKALDVEIADLFVRRNTTIICPHCGKTIKIKTE